METECHDLVDEISGISVDTDDGRPRPGGDVFESNDRHVFEHHPPLPKAPLHANPVTERE